jgi:hypothetical protein
MKKLVALFAFALLLSVASIGISVYDGMRKSDSDDPAVWEADIASFEQADRENAPPDDAVLFVGSSSIRLWHTLAQDMAPLSTIRRGFGGARMRDVVYYADRLINRYAPAKVVIFVGSNDINSSDQPMDAVAIIRDGLHQLLGKILDKRADTDIFYIAITPTISSWEKWQAAQAANAAAESVCASHARCQFIATADLFLDEQGQPDQRLYQFDGLHLSTEGYQRWTRRIKPLLRD